MIIQSYMLSIHVCEDLPFREFFIRLSDWIAKLPDVRHGRDSVVQKLLFNLCLVKVVWNVLIVWLQTPKLNRSFVIGIYA